MLSGPPLAAVALMAFLGLALFRRKKKDDDAKAEVEGAEAEEAEAEASEPAGRPAPKPLVLKAFVLNRKAELVGELAAEGEAMGVGYDGVLELLEGKGLTRVKRIDSPPYTVHILQREEYFMVAFTRSRDDKAVLEEAGALFADTLRDLA